MRVQGLTSPSPQSPEEDRMNDEQSDTVGGYVVPVDPMDALACDSCQ